MSTPSVLVSAEDQLAGFLAKYDPAIERAFRDARARLQALLPGAVELVYDNYNGLVIGYGPSERPSEAILSIVAMPRWVTLCFIQGKALPDPHGVLRGDGSQVRNVRLASPADLESPPIRQLILEAVSRSSPPLDRTRPPLLIIRSISPKQRPRRPKS